MKTVWSAFLMPSNFSARVALFLEVDCLFRQTVLGWLTACLRCLFYSSATVVWFELRYWLNVVTQWNNCVLLIMLNYSFSWPFVCLGWVVHWFSYRLYDYRSLGLSLIIWGLCLGLVLMIWGLGLALGLMSSGLVNNTAKMSRSTSRATLPHVQPTPGQG